MASYYTSVDVSAVAAYPAAESPSVTIPFTPTRITFIHDGSPTAGALVSYDGVVDNAYVGFNAGANVFATPLAHVTKVWLKRFAAGAARVHVIAEQ